jgi:hypothetical protein
MERTIAATGGGTGTGAGDTQVVPGWAMVASVHAAAQSAAVDTTGSSPCVRHPLSSGSRFESRNRGLRFR